MSERGGMHELVAAYALNALDPSEQREFELHLQTCETCPEELVSLQAAAAALAYGVEPAAPPAGLRARVLERAQQETPNVVPLRPRWRSATKTAVALAAAAAIVLGIWAGSLARSLDSERDAREQTDKTLAVLADPEARRIPLEGADGVLVVGSRGAALVVRGLQQTPADKTYEAWVIADGQPKPAGTFDAGSETTVHRLDEPVPRGATVAVTVEPEGGVDAPTGDVLLSAKSA